jgi:hypothetical protein
MPFIRIDPGDSGYTVALHKNESEMLEVHYCGNKLEMLDIVHKLCSPTWRDSTEYSLREE